MVPTSLACGNCVYYALWHKFPPTASWVVILPAWFLVLSVIRTVTGKKLSGIPHFLISLPLVVAALFYGPATLGPMLGLWIPVCIVVGTATGLQQHQRTPLARPLLAITAIAMLCLLLCGALNYFQYYQMPASQRDAFRPDWERSPKSPQQLSE